MQTFQIAKIEVVTHNKVGDEINMVYIRLVGKDKDYSVGRTFNGFLADLKSSHLIAASTVVTMESPSVLKLCRKLKRGYVSGEIAFQNKGDKYTIDEDHNALTNTKHRLYGKVAAGDEMEVLKNGARIKEGMLDFELSERAEVMESDSDALANKRIEMMNIITAAQGTSSNGKAADVEPEEENDFDPKTEGDAIPEGLAEEIIAEKPE